jgi:hypothetical protein
MMSTTEAAAYKNFTTRLSKEALEALDREADREHRSRNGQLEHILTERYGLGEQEAAERKTA